MMSKKWLRTVWVPAAVCLALSAGTILCAAAPEETGSQAPAVSRAYDPNQGEAAIILQGQEGQSLEGKKFQVYRILNALNSREGESVQYSLNPEFEAPLRTVVAARLGTEAEALTEYQILDYIQSLNTEKTEGAQADQEEIGRYSEFRYFAEELRDEILRQQIPGMEVTVENVTEENRWELRGLSFGYYLIDEVTEVDGTSQAASLCMTDTANPEAVILIKSDIPTGVTKSIREDDGDIGWNAIGDYEIGQTIPYRFEAPVPDMYGYDTYYFAFHDSLDEALEFDRESVRVEISQGEKTYVLKDEEDEYVLLQGEEEGETFQIVIDDLKAVVDREFDQRDENGKNVYDQTVAVTYQASLTDRAAEDTGRPGFENKVSLEFSNDPDSGGEEKTGRTPWDTVVCFTYQIDGRKLNEKGLQLQGALFSLYSDPECQEEVYVKKGAEGGYIVINRDYLGGSDHTGGSAPSYAATITSDAEGAFRIYGLDSGVYYLKETRAPEGYRLLEDPVVLTITPSFQEDRTEYLEGDGATDKTLKTLEATADIRSFYDGEYTEEKGTVLETDPDTGTVNLTVINRTGSRLPSTGTPAVLLLTGGGAAMMGISLLAVIKKRRNLRVL